MTWTQYDLTLHWMMFLYNNICSPRKNPKLKLKKKTRIEINIHSFWMTVEQIKQCLHKQQKKKEREIGKVQILTKKLKFFSPQSVSQC